MPCRPPRCLCILCPSHVLHSPPAHSLPPYLLCTQAPCRHVGAAPQPILLLLSQPLAFPKHVSARNVFSCAKTVPAPANIPISEQTRTSTFHFSKGMDELCQLMTPVLPGGSSICYEMGQSLGQPLLPFPFPKADKASVLNGRRGSHLPSFESP